ncbi:hypothetical protein EYF80_020964 [Liparis tanakae]|uniref:Uncharacterized protein n=1 Tax=Liparis tanakae TaxID=230148 RepID=A0A4Z2HSE9_9TELE|nr:hypothetical protein EYF80_020964 [Liparis tanakae]
MHARSRFIRAIGDFLPTGVRGLLGGKFPWFSQKEILQMVWAQRAGRGQVAGYWKSSSYYNSIIVHTRARQSFYESRLREDGEWTSHIVIGVSKVR